MTTSSNIDRLKQSHANHQLQNQHVRSLRWNEKGAEFFELHLKHNELYIRTQIISDEAAERILTLDAMLLSRSSYVFFNNGPIN